MQSLAEVTTSSEHPDFPLINALRNDDTQWISEAPGGQTVRISFREPQTVVRVRLEFTDNAQTQQIAMSWQRYGSRAWAKLRPQKPSARQYQSRAAGAIYEVRLSEVCAVEIVIIPAATSRFPAALTRLEVD